MGITSAFEAAETHVPSNGCPSGNSIHLYTPFLHIRASTQSQNRLREGEMLETDEHLHFSLYALQELTSPRNALVTRSK